MMDALVNGLQALGRYALFMGRAARSVREVGTYRERLVEQMVNVGLYSLPVVMMSGVFAGVVLTIQTAYMLEETVLGESTIGAVVVPSLMLELSALVTGLVMASRIGASMAAEIGTMRVTEQIDALEVMGMNATAYLIIPRVLAGLLMFPALYVASCVSGIAGGAYAGEVLGYVSTQAFIDSAQMYFKPFDPFYGASKTAVFGFIITSIACFKGFTTRGGAEGVGRSTTQAVVQSCVAILFADYLLAELLL
ncbi:MAG: ABC transporter permease [Bacteroidetes bacterium]|nr:MAG: ABC transporter permease [Bacteroidota bacterium]